MLKKLALRDGFLGYELTRHKVSGTVGASS